MRGFALLEIIVAIVLAGLMFTQVHITFGSVMRTFRHYADAVERLPFMQNMIEQLLLDRARGKQPQSRSEQINDPRTTAGLKIAQPKEASALHTLSQLRRITVSAQWPGRQAQQPMELIRFMYLPEKKS